MKKINYVTINGRRFEDCGYTDCKFQLVDGADYDEINLVYKTPSTYKTQVWRGWCDWSHLSVNSGLAINSHSCMVFSIIGYAVDNETGELYVVRITKDHNRAYHVNEI